MKISTKGKYAVIMILDLAEHQNDGYIALKDIAERQGVSKKYLEQIIVNLNRSKLLATNRGYKGGYRLAVSPDKISVGDILRLTEITISPVEPNGSADPDSDESLVNVCVWKGLTEIIEKYLDGISIQDILDKKYELYSNYYMI